MFAADYFIKAYPERIKARYQITDLPETEIELLEMIARQRAFVRKGGLAGSAQGLRDPGQRVPLRYAGAHLPGDP